MRSFSENLELETVLFLLRKPRGDAKQKWEIERNSFLQKLTDGFFGSEMGQHLYKRIHTLIKHTGSFPDIHSVMDDPTLSKEELKKIHVKVKDISKGLEESFISSNYTNQLLARLNAFRVVRESRDLAIFISNSLNNSVEPEVLSQKIPELITHMTFPLGDSEQLISIGKNPDSEEVVSASSEFVEKMLFSEKPPSIPTGFESFDSKSGGIFRGGVFVIAASSGGGKSTLALQLGKNQSERGYKICIVSLEMTHEELFSRLLANIASVPMTTILNLELNTKSKKMLLKQHQQWEDAISKEGGKLDIYAPDFDVSIDDIQLILSPYNYDAVYIDYISLLRGVSGDDSWRELGAVARTCKLWAKQKDCVIGLLAQLSEDFKIRYSRAIGEHASNIWSWVQTEESKESGFVTIKQLKARHQSTFDFTLNQELEFARLSDGNANDSSASSSSEEEESEDDFVAEVARKKKRKS